MISVLVLFLVSVVSVSDFGAVADWDGKKGTDNTESFKAAWNAAAKSSGMLFIPAGDYYLSESFTGTRGVKTVRGEGRATVLHNSKTTCMDLRKVSDLHISGISIEMGNAPDVCGIYLLDAKNITIDNCNFMNIGNGKGSGVGAIHSTSGDGFMRVTNCTVTNCRFSQDAYIAVTAPEFVVSNNYCDGSAQNNLSSHGIYASAGTGISVGKGVVSGNICKGFRRHGIQIAYGDHDLLLSVTGNTISDCGWTGIYFNASWDRNRTQLATIAGNSIEYCGGENIGFRGGIGVYDCTGATTIAGNTIAFSGYNTDGTQRTGTAYGIDANGSKNVTISGNTIVESRCYGVNIEECDGCLVTGNTIEDATVAAINVQNQNRAATTENIIVTSNLCLSRDIDAHGMQLRRSGSTIEHCEIRGNTFINELKESERCGCYIETGDPPPSSGCFIGNTVKGFQHGFYQGNNYFLEDVQYGTQFVINSNRFEEITGLALRTFAFGTKRGVVGKNFYRDVGATFGSREFETIEELNYSTGKAGK